MGKKIKPSFWIVFPLSLALLIAGGIHFIAGNQSKRSPAAEKQKQIIKIEPRTGVWGIAQQLRERGIIKIPQLLVAIASLRGSTQHLKAGEYAFTPGESLLEILKKLEKGEAFHHVVTVPEGFMVRDIAHLLDSKGLARIESFLTLCHERKTLARYGIQGTSLEGYLFPDTYYFSRGMKEEEIIERMINRFFRVFGPKEREKAKRLGLTPHQAITLASLIEAETPMGEERYLVSSVFHRRLRIKMPLQCDPTVIYALYNKYGKRERLSRRDLTFLSPYNTYLRTGLPPGPICNPGASSLEAALAPASTPYLYFVSKGNGTHYFSSTLAEHYRAVRQYRSLPDRS